MALLWRAKSPRLFLFQRLLSSPTSYPPSFFSSSSSSSSSSSLFLSASSSSSVFVFVPVFVSVFVPFLLSVPFLPVSSVHLALIWRTARRLPCARPRARGRGRPRRERGLDRVHLVGPRELASRGRVRGRGRGRGGVRVELAQRHLLSLLLLLVGQRRGLLRRRVHLGGDSLGDARFQRGKERNDHRISAHPASTASQHAREGAVQVRQRAAGKRTFATWRTGKEAAWPSHHVRIIGNYVRGKRGRSVNLNVNLTPMGSTCPYLGETLQRIKSELGHVALIPNVHLRTEFFHIEEDS